MNTVFISLGLMWKGMLAIFVVMLVIFLIVLALIKATSPRNKQAE